MKKIILIAFLISSTNTICAETKDTNRLMFQNLFTNWTYAFNHKNLQTSCALFAKNMVADYRGVPQKNYQTICDGFKKIFADKEKDYRYQFKIHQIYTENNLAAVRLTWYLTILKNGNVIETIQDEGLDIFKKNSSGQWQIVNYLGYSVA